MLTCDVAGVYRALDKLLDKKQQGKVFTYDGGMAFHAIMYHLQGGLDSRLRAPAPPSAELQRLCKPAFKAARILRAAYFPAISDAKRKAKSGNNLVLLHLRTDIFDRSHLVGDTSPQPEIDADQKIHSTVVAAGGGGGGDPVDPAMLQRSELVGELVILGRPLHTQPLIPRYLYTVIGS